MDPSSKFAGAVVTPTKEKTFHPNRSKLNENFDPNVSSPALKSSRSPSMIKSGSSAKKSVSRKPKINPVASPPAKKKIRQRKFVIAKKKSQKEEADSTSACEKCKNASSKSKCLCVAYESLRASQEDFFKNRAELDNEIDNLAEIVNEGNKEGNDENGELGLKRSRDMLSEEARERVPEPGSGRVKHLVEAFEKLKMMPKSGESEEQDVEEVEDDKQGIKWALPGLQQTSNVSEAHDSSSSFCSSDFFLTSASLGLDSRRSYSSDSSQGSISTRTSGDGPKSRRRSTESSGTLTRRQWKKKQQKATSQKPFMLRTEQRGRCKEEEFMKKLQQMVEEEEKLRIPVAQGLPWTTDEPECLVKPPVKEKTRPVDLILHSDERAMERAEFDDQVAKKLDLIEQYRTERDRQQKLAEEEEVKRLRKVLVPKAQPMPYFDRPFVPRRSMKHQTVPKEPRFHLPQQKKIKCNLSLDDDDQSFIHNWSE